MNNSSSMRPDPTASPMTDSDVRRRGSSIGVAFGVLTAAMVIVAFVMQALLVAWACYY